MPGSTQAHGLHLNEITVIDTVYDGFWMKTAYRIPNMGWMNDMLEYMSKDPVHRRYHHNNLTFSLLYAFTENFVLPFSHDEVVHGKGAILSKMPGDHWQKFANLRALYGYMYAHPGKKLLFMGGEIGQWSEWNHWHLAARLGACLTTTTTGKCRRTSRRLQTRLACVAARLHQVDFSWEGFQWIDFHDVDNSVVVPFVRRAKRSPAISSRRWLIARPCRAHGYRSLGRARARVLSR